MSQMMREQKQTLTLDHSLPHPGGVSRGSEGGLVILLEGGRVEIVLEVLCRK